ncbi:protocatechuate 3,4-dioxygenase, alpha subunit [Enhydrobacter aerosaccus]|uniref:Protocatechuate 3,4-dioxygenase, alpha subunit n=1 Tax=Enhydrobacter aerosaccus TaxID=225324 RepID=A0A1T4NCF5_9HYPH|nr:protocatechuate 3,4-dioxygenase subunit alpha [Enhydrobacter aerosaccus]SJZ76950.1 protocatechuate 3,4-dioxygenase, alpha subunit [Enhydrobacter aerosaccus]
MSKGLTPSQTIGPFYVGTLVKAYRQDLAPPNVAGEHVEIVLSLHDADGMVVPDGVFEIWQANSHGRYNHPDDRRNLPLDPGFEGFGRASTWLDGSSQFSTIKPGRVPWPQGGLQAPHINVSIFARGLLNRVATRLYFEGDPANAEDPVLKMIEPARRSTLLAQRDANGTWRLPIHLGGPQETVFFDC